MVVIVLSGMPGAGKEVFAQTAIDGGYDVIRMGDVVRKHALDSGLGMDDLSVGSYANTERELHGKEIWAIRTLEVASGENIVIDGCRSKDELAYFKTHIDEITTIGIDAPYKTRFERLVSRGREDDPKVIDEFERRERRETGWGLKEAVDSAQIKLINDSDIDTFRNICRQTLNEVKKTEKVFNQDSGWG